MIEWASTKRLVTLLNCWKKSVCTLRLVSMCIALISVEKTVQFIALEPKISVRQVNSGALIVVAEYTPPSGRLGSLTSISLTLGHPAINSSRLLVDSSINVQVCKVNFSRNGKENPSTSSIVQLVKDKEQSFPNWNIVAGKNHWNWKLKLREKLPFWCSNRIVNHCSMVSEEIGCWEPSKVRPDNVCSWWLTKLDVIAASRLESGLPPKYSEKCGYVRHASRREWHVHASIAASLQSRHPIILARTSIGSSDSFCSVLAKQSG